MFDLLVFVFDFPTEPSEGLKAETIPLHATQALGREEV
jgi:hypothetical protein